MRLMRKPPLTLSILVVAIGLVVVAGAVYMRHDYASRVRRADSLVRNLRQLAIGKSDYKVAEAIATKFGNAPPPYWTSAYPKENCAARDHLEPCAFIIAMNDSPIERLWLKHPSLPHLGVRDWRGSAVIVVTNGAVNHYSFSVWYESSNGQWRGFGMRESEDLPKYERVQARISDSYSIERSGTSETGFGLQSSLTPAATETERWRASHFVLACLDQRQSCGEICEVMPDAWRDFYEKRGRFDVEASGSAYLFCSEPPK
jgi:hypothetical protein